MAAHLLSLVAEFQGSSGNTERELGLWLLNTPKVNCVYHFFFAHTYTPAVPGCGQKLHCLYLNISTLLLTCLFHLKNTSLDMLFMVYYTLIMSLIISSLELLSVSHFWIKLRSFGFDSMRQLDSDTQ